MPPLPLTAALTTALPSLSATSRAVVSALGCFNGHAPSAGELASLLGMRSRYQLARTLRHDGLPPLEELAGWARVLHWILEAADSGASLHQLAQAAGLDSATAYRLVHRVTGMRWSDLQPMGLPAVLHRFQERCRSIGRRERTRDARGTGRARRPPTAKSPRAGAGALPGSMLGEASGRRASRVRAGHPSGVLESRHLIGGNPFDVAINADGIGCVTRAHVATVDFLSLKPLRALGSVQTGPVPTRVVFNGAGDLAYVTSQFAEEVGIIDVPRLSQVAAIGVPGHPMASALSLDGRTLYVTTNLDRLCSVSLASGRVVCSIPVPQICTELALDPSGRRLYVPTWRAGSILEVDAHTLRVLRRFEVGGKVQGLALPSDGSLLFAANEEGWLDVIHVHSGRRLTRLDFGSTAFGVAVSPDDAVVYVSLLFAGLVVIVDRATLGIQTSLHPGGRPRRICFDTCGRTALVANEEGWVDVVR